MARSALPLDRRTAGPVDRRTAQLMSSQDPAQGEKTKPGFTVDQLDARMSRLHWVMGAAA